MMAHGCGVARFSDELADVARNYWQLSRTADAFVWCEQAGVALTWREQLHAGHYTPGARAQITLRSRLRRERITFILAHELGHHFLAQCRTDARLRSSLPTGRLTDLASFAPGSDDEEEMCDRFAAALLLDSRRARLWVDNSPPTIESLWNFAIYAQLDVRDAFQRIVDCTGHRATLLHLDIADSRPVVSDAFGPLANRLRGAEAMTSIDWWHQEDHVNVDLRIRRTVLRIAGTFKRVGAAVAYALVTRCGTVLSGPAKLEL